MYSECKGAESTWSGVDSERGREKGEEFLTNSLRPRIHYFFQIERILIGRMTLDSLAGR